MMMYMKLTVTPKVQGRVAMADWEGPGQDFGSKLRERSDKRGVLHDRSYKLEYDIFFTTKTGKQVPGGSQHNGSSHRRVKPMPPTGAFQVSFILTPSSTIAAIHPVTHGKKLFFSR